MTTSDDRTGLDGLEHQLRHDLSVLELPGKSWVPARSFNGQRVRDVVIVGGGMCGLVSAAVLRFMGVDNIVCLDRAPQGREGPWVTIARMRTLRSPKQLTGPALGQPALTFRAWYEAQFGQAQWMALDKIPRAMWMDYLVWYRKVLELPVQNRAEVKAITAVNNDLLAVEVDHLNGEHAETVYARHVVLATGRDGLGAPFVPAFAQGIDRRFWAHTADDIDFDRLEGKRVAVIGAGASAMDNAATALELGAGSVDMFVRRPDLPRINKFTGISSQGVVHGFAVLSDPWKWKFLDHTLSAQTPPPRDSTLRVSRHANARFHLSSPVTALVQKGDAVVLSTPRGSYDVDFVIFGTGFIVDTAQRPELAAFSDNIAYWKDRFTPETGGKNGELANSPYLGPSFQFTEKTPGLTPGLERIHSFNFPATLSHGKLSGDIPAVSEGGQRLGRGIVRSLFVEDQQIHFANLVAYDTPELQGDEWVDHEAQDAAHAGTISETQT